jgi:hypothetical protein
VTFGVDLWRSGKLSFFDGQTSFEGVESFLLLQNSSHEDPKTPDLVGFEKFRDGNCLAYCNVEGTNPLTGLFWGKAILEDGCHFWDLPDDVDSAALRSSVGCHLRLKKEDFGYRVSMDRFGQGFVFYGEFDGTLVVTNRLLLFAEYFSAIGKKLSLDEGATYMQFFSETSLGKQPLTRRSVFEGMFCLRPGETVKLDAKAGLSVETFQANRSMMSFEEYNDGLTRCAESMANKFFRAAEYFDEITVSLTAGVDSRSAFSLALCAVGSERMSRFLNPKEPIDSFGAHFLGEKYGVRPVTDFVETEFSDEAMANMLERELVENFGVTNDIKSLKLDMFLPDCLKVGGAGGEVHRTAYGKRFAELPFYSFPYSNETGKEMFQRLCSGKLSKDAEALMEQAFLEELSQLPGETLAQRMESVFFFHVNRAHFRDSLTKRAEKNGMALSPLLDGDLLELSLRAPVPFKNTDQVLKGLTEKWVPGASQIAYNKDLAKEHSFEWRMGPRAPLASAYDVPLSPLVLSRLGLAEKGFASALDATLQEALEILTQAGRFGDILEFGERKLAWMKTLPGHNYIAAWPSRLVQLAKLTTYTQ